MSRIGIITALPTEAYSICKKRIAVRQITAIDSSVWLYVSGIGAHNARVGMQALADAGIDRVINWGVTTALDASCRSGDLQLPTQLTDGVTTITIDSPWHHAAYTALAKTQQTLHTGTLVSVANPLSTPRQKQMLAKTTVGVAADMEAYALAVMAIEIGVELLVVKAVADDANTVLPNCVLAHTDQYGRPRARFMLEVLSRPRQILELLKLALCFRCAMRSLRVASTVLSSSAFYSAH